MAGTRNERPTQLYFKQLFKLKAYKNRSYVEPKQYLIILIGYLISVKLFINIKENVNNN